VSCGYFFLCASRTRRSFASRSFFATTCRCGGSFATFAGMSGGRLIFMGAMFLTIPRAYTRAREGDRRAAPRNVELRHQHMILLTSRRGHRRRGHSGRGRSLDGGLRGGRAPTLYDWEYVLRAVPPTPRMFLPYRLLAFLLISAWPLFAAAQVTIFPPSPKPDETVRVLIQGMGGDPMLDARVSMTNNKITLEVITASGGLGVPPAWPPFDFPIGRFPTGDYQVEVIRRSIGSPNAFPVGLAAFSVSERSPSAPLFDYTGLWWNAQESGWAVNIVQQPSGMIFATWLAYDSNGTPVWYSVSSGQWSRPDGVRDSPPNVYVGDIYRTSGPLVADTFDASKVTRTLVGQLRLTFSERPRVGKMGAEITVDGKTVTRDLQRFEF
jgi:hypothetical protein